MLSLLSLRNAAHADCMMPRAFFSADLTAPLSATAFFFAPPGTAAQPRFTVLDAEQAPVPFTTESLGGQLGAWQLKIEATIPGSITLSAAFEEDTWITAAPLTVAVTADWQAPQDRSLVSVKSNSMYWACSHQLSTDLEVTGTAPAAWAVDWDAGKRQTDWLPGTAHGFFPIAPDRSSRLELGHLSCLGDVFVWSSPDSGGGCRRHLPPAPRHPDHAPQARVSALRAG
ncbi:MAG: hypothetical protein ACI8S6_000318 [Myxococcota bacterium]|jgi:hypothetical protein